MTRTKQLTETGDDTLKAYYSAIKSIPLLTFEEELELSRRILSGDERAKERLINSNLRLVIKIARQFSSQDMSLMDLIQEGNLGLMKAASRYDFERNVRFSTYASWWIKQSISRALANKRRAIRIPHRKEEAARRIQRAINTLSLCNSRNPTLAEISKETGLSTECVKETLRLTAQVVSLDAETMSESGTMMDLFEDYSFSPDADLMSECIRAKTMEVLTHLMDKEREILMYRFAFAGGKKQTLKSIGTRMGISPETVRQIEIRAMNKLKREAEDIREYVYC